MAKVAAPAAEEYDVERDLTGYLDKAPTAKMEDYHEWLEGVLGVEIDKDSMFLGVTLYPDFQRSNFNRGRTAARREARAAGNGETEAEAPAKATPAKRGRPPKAAAAKATPAKATPAKRGRGRAAAGTAAPY
jgi:hypothetical protein